MSPPLSAKVPFGGDDNPQQWPEDTHPDLLTAALRLPAYGVVVLEEAR
ncbi:hypothetical protein ACLQ3B_12865 [Micromonospora sp. DT53]